MGNFTVVERLVSNVMAARRPAIGIDHLTTVPENFDPPGEDENEEDLPEE